MIHCARFVLAGQNYDRKMKVVMSVTQSMMDVMSLCATVVFIEVNEAGQKVAEVHHR